MSAVEQDKSSRDEGTHVPNTEQVDIVHQGCGWEKGI